MKEKVTLYAGPVAYKSWFTYNNRRFVIDLDQNKYYTNPRNKVYKEQGQSVMKYEVCPY